MPLVKCSQCGHSVSTQATACPGCGAPPSGELAPLPRKRPHLGLVVVLWILVFPLAFVASAVVAAVTYVWGLPGSDAIGLLVGLGIVAACTVVTVYWLSSRPA